MAGGAGEGHDVADVLHARDPHQHAGEPEPEAPVGRGAEPAQIEVPPQVLVGHAAPDQLLLQGLEALLALRAADDLPQPRHQQVGGGHGLLVVVEAHVEGLLLDGVVGDEDRLAEVLLG